MPGDKMLKEKIKQILVEKFSTSKENKDVVYEMFINSIEERINENETIKIDELGYFKREENELIFVNENHEADEPLFQTIKKISEISDQFSLNENILSVGAESETISARDVVEGNFDIEELEEKINSEISKNEILKDFDPIEVVANETKTAEDLENQNSSEDDDWSENLENELLGDDFFDDIQEEDEAKEDVESEEKISVDNDIDVEELEEEKIIESENSDEVQGEKGLIVEEDVIDQDQIDSMFEDFDDEVKPTVQGKKEDTKQEEPKESEEEKTEESETQNETEEPKSKKKLILIILIVVFVLLTAGGVYYFFFMGGEEHSENHSEVKADTTLTHKPKPFTKIERGEGPEDNVQSHDVHSDNLNEEIKEDYNQVDPRLIREFKDEIKISNVIYKHNGKYMVQISSWKQSERASSIAEKLYERGYDAFVVKAYLPQLGGYWYRVRVGFFETELEAREFLKEKRYQYVRGF